MLLGGCKGSSVDQAIVHDLVDYVIVPYKNLETKVPSSEGTYANVQFNVDLLPQQNGEWLE